MSEICLHAERARELTISISQHMSILPEAAQIAWKLGTSVGTGDAKRKEVSEFVLEQYSRCQD